MINKVGGSVDRVNGQLDKVDRITDSAVDAADSVDTAVRAVSMAITRPVQKVSGIAAGVSYGAADFKVEPRLAARRAGRQGGRGAARAASSPKSCTTRGDERRDEIRLVIPAEEDFRPIAHLVVGGLAVRLDLTFEDLDDLQVALEALLALPRRRRTRSSSRCRADDGAVRAAVGPFPPERCRRRARTASLDLHRVLETVCDTLEVEERDGGAWVELTQARWRR